MTPRRGRPTLAERSAAMRERRAKGQVARHCWVIDPPGAPGRWPGLLTEWRRTASGWQGLVVFRAALPGGDEVMVQAWVDAASLESAQA